MSDAGRVALVSEARRVLLSDAAGTRRGGRSVARDATRGPSSRPGSSSRAGQRWRTWSRDAQVGLFSAFAIVMLVVVLLIGLAFALSYRGEADRRGLEQGRSEAVLMAQTAIGPLLDGRPLSGGLSAAEGFGMRRLVSTATRSHHVLRLRLRDLAGNVVFSNDGSGLHQPANNDNRDEIASAARGVLVARLTTLDADNATGPRGPAVVEVYLPLSGGPRNARVGVLEVYLPYAPIRAEVNVGLHQLYRNLFVGLGALYAVLLGIAYTVGRRLRHQVRLTTYVGEHDLLTGLANRTLFQRHAEAALRRGLRRASPVTIAIVDLDKFKEINDTLGHHNGDVLLESLARAMSEALPDVASLARLGGDEFGVVLEGVGDPVRVLDGLRRAIEREVMVSGIPLSIESSVGFATSPEHGSDFLELMPLAEIAMYTAKERHLGVARYHPSQNRYVAADLALIAQLRQAIEGDELTLHYQPQIDVRSGEVEGVEALVRWNHPEQGLLYPDRFIPLAEQTDLIDRLTDWVVARAISDMARVTSGTRGLSVSVNVSARNLGKPGFAQRVVRELRAAGVAPERLIVEVTETALMTDPQRARSALEELSRAGVRLSIDDFGVGQTSLSYLSNLPISELKVDRGFVTDMLENASHRAIVNSIIDLGQNLGLRVVAEGVETAAILDELVDAQCDVAQGYLFARPMPIGDLAEWMGRRPDLATV